MPTIDERFHQLHPKSEALSEKAEELFPNGVTHDSRKFGPFRVYMDRGLGPYMWDIDGNEYIDYRTGHGSMILGQAHPNVVQAVSGQMAKGTHLNASTELEVQWGQLVKELVPSAEKLRFVASGTEAIMMAFRMGRAYSGKNRIVKFQGAFHGWADGPFVAAEADNLNNGIPPQVRDTIIAVPYEIDSVERVLKQGDVAAIIFQGNQVIQPSFIQQLRDLTQQLGVILIVDEVVSGFRFSRGGCQGLYGIVPDLTGLAKILAGGLPGGCITGKSDIIDTIAPGKISHPGTFNANPLSAAAGCAALQLIIDEPILDTADLRAQRLKDGLNEILGKMEIPGCAYGVSSIIHMRLGADHECDRIYCDQVSPATTTGFSNETIGLLHRALINENVWGSPTSFILSATHSEEDIDTTLVRYEEALRQVRSEGAI